MLRFKKYLQERNYQVNDIFSKLKNREWKTATSFKEYLLDLGKNLGSGAHSTAFTNPKLNDWLELPDSIYVIKINDPATSDSGEFDNAQFYYKELFYNAPKWANNVLTPEIVAYHEFNSGGYAVAMPFLVEIGQNTEKINKALHLNWDRNYGNFFDEMMRWLKMTDEMKQYNPEFEFSIEKLIERDYLYEDILKDKVLCDSLIQFCYEMCGNVFLKNGVKYLDLHAHNIGFERGGKYPILFDPVSF